MGIKDSNPFLKKEFFEPLVKAGEEHIVVLDGGGLETNVRDTIKRREEGIGVFQSRAGSRGVSYNPPFWECIS